MKKEEWLEGRERRMKKNDRRGRRSNAHRSVYIDAPELGVRGV